MNTTTINHKVKRGEIYYCDLGNKEGSIQNGVRPVIVVQCNEGNQASPTTIVAALTTSIKKRYMPSHIILEDNFGLKYPSMVMLEQLSTVNQSELEDYVGTVDDPAILKQIDIGLKKALGMWVYKKPTNTDTVLCLCPKCLSDYNSIPNVIIRRVDPFNRTRERCDKCYGMGYDYLITKKNNNC